MDIAADLLAAYTRTDFLVFDAEGAWCLNVGLASSRADALMADCGAYSAAFITAFNPRSEILPPTENARRHAALLAAIERGTWRWLEGEGRDPTGDWAPEPSCLILGITLQDALDLARQFDQNAIVFLERGKAPWLAFPGE